MLTNAKDIKGFVIHANDGEIGTVDEFYFDDESWAIRYLVVNTGSWLNNRQVLISPISVGRTDWQAKQLHVALSKKQVENSPAIDTHRPISRQHEAAFMSYYSYPYYWGGPLMWGDGFYPASLALPLAVTEKAVHDRAAKHPEESHLRSSQAVTGYHIEAMDGEIGHLEGFVLDDETWAIRYIEVSTRNWLPGKKVLFSPAWIQKVSWREQRVYVGIYRDTIKGAPEFFESRPIDRNYEGQLYLHYGRPPYWVHEAEQTSAHALSSV